MLQGSQEIRNYKDGLSSALAESSLPAKLSIQTKTIIEKWQAAKGASLSSREYGHLFSCLLHNLEAFQPKIFFDNSSGVSAAVFPNLPNSNRKCEAFLLVNDGSHVSFNETHLEFAGFNPESLRVRVLKLASRDAQNRDKPLANYRRLPFTNDWVSPDSPLVESWIKIISNSIVRKAEAVGIKSLQNKKAATELAANCLNVFHEQLAKAFEALMLVTPTYTRADRYGRTSNSLLTEASRFADLSQRTAMVQFIISAPFLASSDSPVDSTIHQEILQRVIDRKPLLAESSLLLNCPPAILSRVRRVPLSTISRCMSPYLEPYNVNDALKEFGLSFQIVASFVRHVPPSNLPYFENEILDRGDLKAFAKILSAVMRLAIPNPQATRNEKIGVLSSATLFAIEALGTGTKGRWAQVSKQLNPHRLSQISHVHDMVNAIDSVTILPKLLRDRYDGLAYLGQIDQNSLLRISRAITLAILARNSTLIGLLKISDAWHRTGALHQNSSVRYSWPDLIEKQKAPNGNLIIPLSSSAELQEEGTFMHHCVGGYGSYCVRGVSRIFSIQDSQGQRLSTLEVRIGEVQDSSRLSIRQNHARFNHIAPSSAQDSAEWLVREVNEGRIQANWEEVKKYAHRVSSKDLCGFDPCDDLVWLREYKAIQSILPAAIAADSPREFLEKIDFRSLLNQLIKQYN